MSSRDVVRDYLEALRSAEASFETRFRGFIQNVADDLDLQAAFLSGADNARDRRNVLGKRLEEIAGGSEQYAHLMQFVEIPSPLGNANRIEEERAVQDLIAAFAIHSSESAMSEVLAALAAGVPDSETESLGKEICEQARQAAGRVFSLIQSRAKIAFNMLTPNELDPAIETKMADDRVI